MVFLFFKCGIVFCHLGVSPTTVGEVGREEFRIQIQGALECGDEVRRHIFDNEHMCMT